MTVSRSSCRTGGYSASRRSRSDVRGGGTALRWSLGRRALRGGPHGLGEESSGVTLRDPCGHRPGREVQRRRRLRRALPLGGASPIHGRCLEKHRRACRADLSASCDVRGTRGRPNRAEQPAWDLHQLREPARPLRPHGARPFPGGWSAVQHHPDRATRARWTSRGVRCAPARSRLSAHRCQRRPRAKAPTRSGLCKTQ